MTQKLLVFLKLTFQEFFLWYFSEGFSKDSRWVWGESTGLSPAVLLAKLCTLTLHVTGIALWVVSNSLGCRQLAAFMHATKVSSEPSYHIRVVLVIGKSLSCQLTGCEETIYLGKTQYVQTWHFAFSSKFLFFPLNTLFPHPLA